MKFTDTQLTEMQLAGSEHYRLSATFSAALTMGNCVGIHQAIDRRRRIDGTVTADDVKAVFQSADVQLDEWALGKVNFAEIADDFNLEREPVPISDTVRHSLISMNIEGNSGRLSAQLDRTDYAKVNKILEALGAKWNKKTSSHVFTSRDPEEAIASYLESGKLDKPQKFGFFPTPAPLARELVNLAGLQPGDTVLEPEAGVGGLANICAEIVGKGNISCYEIQQKHCEVLRSLGFKVLQADFLEVEPTQLFSAVILNPPFEKQADIDHVMHAFKFLQPGGTMAAIMSIAITFRTNSKTQQFRNFLDSVGAKVTPNDANAFRESGTSAQTVKVVLKKPTNHSVTDHTQIRTQNRAASSHEAPTHPIVQLPKACPNTPRLARKQQPAQATFSF